jgi:hypothetical protein
LLAVDAVGIEQASGTPRRLRISSVLRDRRARRQRRRDADRRIVESVGPPPGDVAWRAAELTSTRERKLLARSLRGVVIEVSNMSLPGVSPLNRVALRPHTRELKALADRLADLDTPVDAAGVIRIQRLLTDPDGPLYARAQDTVVLGWALDALLDELEAA